MTWSEPDAWTWVAAAVLDGLADDADAWMVLKHHERLPAVSGDIDLCVPQEAWDRTLDVIAGALAELGDFGITYCEHWPHVRLMFIVPMPAGDAPTRLLQIDFIDGVHWRGVQLAPASALLTDLRVGSDARNAYPHSSAGLQAALFLTAYAVRGSGRLSSDALHAKDIGSLVRADPEGFIQAMSLCHGRFGALAARAFLDDRWRSHLGLLLHARRLLRHPLAHLNLAAAWLERRRVMHWRRISRDLPHGISDWQSIHARRHAIEWTSARPAAIGSAR